MLRIDSIPDLRERLRDFRIEGRSIGLVPTMGALHEGHLSLIRECTRRANIVVATIFVNPLQFGPSEDFERYPRDIEGDLVKAAAAGADVCFAPSRQEMFPLDTQVTVTAGRAGEVWEGAVRPGHFAGVLTVVAKLFNIVQPDVAVFGQKDHQQAVLIARMTRELSFPLSLVIAPTVRAADGLALSSRNAYLSAEHRSLAQAIPRVLALLHGSWTSGNTRREELVLAARRALAQHGVTEIDYLDVVDAESLEPVRETARRGDVVLLAARVGDTRLIDNLILDEILPPELAGTAAGG